MRKRKLPTVSYEIHGQKLLHLRSDDCDREADRVQAAGSAQGRGVGDLVSLSIATKALLRVRVAIAERGLDVAFAATCPVSSKNGNGNEGTAEEDIEDYAEKSEDRLSAQAACEENGEDGVEDCSTRDAFDSLGPGVNWRIAVGENGKEVAVDTQYYA